MSSGMIYKNYEALLEYIEEDDSFVGHIAGIKDIVGFHADAMPALQAAFQEAVNDYLSTCVKADIVPQQTF